MAHRILFFESDARFASDVQAALQRRGAEVEVTSDGNAGVDRAVEAQPNLILLTIELPGANGWLLSKKLRKLTETATIPIILLSSEATEEVFEQHRRLRTRAEDYVHKPVSIEALVERVGRILALEEEIVDEDVDIAFDSPPTELVGYRAQGPASVGVDDEIDAFADSAFDNLVTSDEEATRVGVMPAIMPIPMKVQPRPKMPSERPAPPPPPAPPPAALERPVAVVDEGAAKRLEELEERLAESNQDNARMQDALRDAETRADEAATRAESAESSAAQRDTERKAERAADAENRSALLTENATNAAPAQDTERDQEREAELGRAKSDLARVERELAEAKRAPVAPKTSIPGSGRDILDLQAQLNRKDKDLLDHKDQLSAKEKQILELRDRNLELERAQADANDHQLEIERQLVDLREHTDVLVADKETVSKRAEDFRARLERTELKSKKLEEDLAGERALRASDLARLTEDHLLGTNALDTQHRAALEKAAAEAEAARSALVSTHEALVSTHEALVSKLTGEHTLALEEATSTHAAETLAAKSEHSSAIDALRGELEQAGASALEALRTSTSQELERRLAEAGEEKTTALAAATAAAAAATLALRAEHESTLKTSLDDLGRRHGSELAALGRKLAEAESTMTSQSARLEQSQTELDAANQELATHRTDLANTRDELVAKKAVLASVDSDLTSLRSKHAELETQKLGVDAELQSTSTRAAELDVQLVKARAKVAGDEAILERARKAFAIGLSLLEDQKSNAE